MLDSSVSSQRTRCEAKDKEDQCQQKARITEMKPGIDREGKRLLQSRNLEFMGALKLRAHLSRPCRCGAAPAESSVPMPPPGRGITRLGMRLDGWA
jgi:hypothetical protein